MNKTINTVLFDLDGTLVETVHEISDATNDTLEEIGVSQVSEDQVRSWIGHGTRELLINALAHVKQVPELEIRQSKGLNDIFKIFDDFYLMRCGTRSHLYPGVKEVLDSFKSAGLKMAVVTNKESRFTKAVMKSHGLDTYFKIVVSGDTLTTKKPDPQGIFFCLEKLSASPSQAIFIGDSLVDAKTAQNAGLAVWLLPYGYNMGQPLQNANADLVLDSFNDLLKLLNIV